MLYLLSAKEVDDGELSSLSNHDSFLKTLPF